MKTRNKTVFLVMISFIMLFAVVLAIPKVANGF